METAMHNHGFKRQFSPSTSINLTTSSLNPPRPIHMGEPTLFPDQNLTFLSSPISHHFKVTSLSMAATNTTLHLPTLPPIPTNPSDLSAATAPDMEHHNHIPLPPPALLSTYIATCVSLLIVAALMVGWKFTLTWKARGRFGMDDAMIGLGLVTLIATGVLGGKAYNHGLGKPNTLIDGKYPSWIAFYWEYIFYTVWFTPLWFSKLAFFFMYTRTFQGRWMKRSLYASMVVFTVFTILFITGTTLMNLGIKQSRFEAIKALRYHVQFKYLHYAWGVCDILADLWICVLPLWGLRVLEISRGRRFKLTSKFAVPAITFAISMARIYELNLVMSRDIMKDHAWDPSLAETVPLVWAFGQAAAAVIITTLPSIALRLSIWYKRFRALKSEATTEQEQRLGETQQLSETQHLSETQQLSETQHLSETQRLSGTTEGNFSNAETGESTPADSFTATTSSVPTSSTLSKLSKAEKILGVGQRFKRSRTPDEYSEEAHRLDQISGITVTRTVNVTSALDPEEGFKYMYRKYCGQA